MHEIVTALHNLSFLILATLPLDLILAAAIYNIVTGDAADR